MNSSSIDKYQYPRDVFPIIFEKSVALCKPASSPVPEDEYDSCCGFLKSLENIIILSHGGILSNGGANVCGQIFKSREPVYSCRDCATDETCVLCRNCFVNSEHTKHNYQMFTSGGGGCCDCGDVEAWKSNPRCTLHGGTTDNQTECIESIGDYDKYIDQIPDDVKERFLETAMFIVDNFRRFVMTPLCKNSKEARERALKIESDILINEFPSLKTSELALVLYNNEFHNFDQVITLFKRHLQCSQEQALAFANVVDRDGRCMALISNDTGDLKDKQRDILHKSKSSTSMELLCRLHHPSILAFQSFFLHALRWLSEFVERYPKLRLLLCRYLLTDNLVVCGRSVPMSGFIKDVFDKHTEMWKSARRVCTNFVIRTVFKDNCFKRLFSSEFVKNYKSILNSYSVDDHNCEDSLVSITCQLFTVISLGRYLLENENCLDVIVQIVHDMLIENSRPLPMNERISQFYKEESEIHKKFDPFERNLRAMEDIKYILRSVHTSLTGCTENDNDYNQPSVSATSKLIGRSLENFLSYFQTLVDVFMLIQDTNTIERVTENHVEHDPQWRNGIIIMYEFVSAISLTAQIIHSSTECWRRAFKIIRKAIKTRITDTDCNGIEDFSLFGRTTSVINNDWPNKFISIIKPLHRMMASMLVSDQYRQQLTELESDCLLDQALQMAVFCSQQAGNMWIRNGSVPYILTQQIKCPMLGPEMFDRDLQLIQQMAAHMQPDEFILKVIHKFDLGRYLENDSAKQEKRSLLQRTEDFLHLLIVTLFYRHRIGVGQDMTIERIFENLLLHIMCIKPMSHSKMTKKMPLAMQRYNKNKLLDIINRVSDQTRQGQVVIFTAKKQLVAQNFNRFNPIYSLQDRNEAELYVQNFLRKDGSSCAIVVPQPVELSDDFRSLYRYFSTPMFVELLRRFVNIIAIKRNGEMWNDTILDMILYLINGALMEDLNALDSQTNQRSVDSGALFIDACGNAESTMSILGNLELLCDKVTNDQQLEMVKWTIKKWHEVRRRRTDDHGTTESAMDVDNNDEIDGSSTKVSQSKIAKADAAKRRREQLMNKMMRMQKKFINENSNLLLMDMPDQQPQGTECASSDDIETSAIPSGGAAVDYTCILCQENDYEEQPDRAMVAIGGAWRSTVASRHPFTKDAPSIVDNDRQQPTATDDVGGLEWLSSEDEQLPDSSNERIDRLAPRQIVPMLDHAEETFITTCGHLMHFDCKTRYLDDMIKHKRNYAKSKGSFYPQIFTRCPLCKCVYNIDIPVIRNPQSNADLFGYSDQPPQLAFDKWFDWFTSWTPTIPEVKKERNIFVEYLKTKFEHSWSSLIRTGHSYKVTNIYTTTEELLASLPYRTALAIKLQPTRLTKDTYHQFENIRASCKESSAQELIQFGYAITYTMALWEQILDKDGQSLLTNIPERHGDGLHRLIHAGCRAMRSVGEKEHRSLQSYFLLLRMMTCDPVSAHKAWADLTRQPSPRFLLETDFLYVLSSLLLLRHFLDARLHQQHCDDRNTFNFHAVALTYQLHCAQALLSMTDDDNRYINTDDTDDRLWQLRKILVTRCPLVSLAQLSPSQVNGCFHRSVLPFLRCAAYLLSALGSVRLPVTYADSNTEFIALLALLRLDGPLPFTDRLPTRIERHLQQLSESHHRPLLTLWGASLPHSMPLVAPSLIDLPTDFTDVIARCLERGCTLSRQMNSHVADIGLCLVCGQTFCLAGYCCRTGEDLSGAQVHARQVHGGYAVFLNARDTKVVVLFYQARWQVRMDPIYFDKFGESDVELKRSNPLFLNRQSYRRLQRAWMDHSLGIVISDGFNSSDFFV